MTVSRKLRTSLAALAVVGSLFAGACSDEDGDGATTDEEVEDVENQAEDVQNQVDEEIEGQDEGSNQDGE